MQIEPAETIMRHIPSGPYGLRSSPRTTCTPVVPASPPASAMRHVGRSATDITKTNATCLQAHAVQENRSLPTTRTTKGMEHVDLPAELLDIKSPTFHDLSKVTEVFSIPTDAFQKTPVQVRCRGTFSSTGADWGEGHPCELTSDGKFWLVEVEVHPGMHQFEFVADGQEVHLSSQDRTGYDAKQKRLVNFRVILSHQKALVNPTQPASQKPIKDLEQAEEVRKTEFKRRAALGIKLARPAAQHQQLVPVDPVMLFAVRAPSGYHVQLQCMLLQTHVLQYDMVCTECEGDSSLYFFALPTIQTHAGIVPMEVWFQAANEANNDCFTAYRPSTKEDPSAFWQVREPGAYFVDCTLPKKLRELRVFRFATASTASNFTDILDLAAQPSRSLVADSTTQLSNSHYAAAPSKISRSSSAEYAMQLNNILVAGQLSKSYTAVQTAADSQRTRGLVAA